MILKQQSSKIFLSNSFFSQKKKLSTFRYVKDALIQSPDNIDLLCSRIDAYFGLNNLEEALKDIKKIIEIAATSPKGYFKLGQLYLFFDEADQAKEAFEQGLQHDSIYYPLLEAHEKLKLRWKEQKVQISILNGKKYFEENNLTLALNYFDDAIKELPENAYFYALRATVNAALSRTNEASEDALKLVSLSPNWVKNNPTYQGYVQKQGKINTMMKKRWLILKGYFVFYYNSSTVKKNKKIFF